MSGRCRISCFRHRSTNPIEPLSPGPKKGFEALALMINQKGARHRQSGRTGHNRIADYPLKELTTLSDGLRG